MSVFATCGAGRRTRYPYMVLLLLAVVATGCSAIDTVCAEEDTPAAACRSRRDRSLTRGLRSVSQPKLFGRTCGVYALLTVATSPLTEPGGVASALRVLRLPLGGPVRSALLSLAAGLYSVRQRFEWAILMWHEAFTSLSADLLAQAIESPHAEVDEAEEERGEATATVGAGDGGSSGGAGADSGSSTGGGGGGGGRHTERAVDWRRAARTATVSLLSDDLPFLVWSRLIWLWAEKAKAALRASALAPRWIRVLTHHATVTVAKMALTQLVYETASDSAYLAMQDQPPRTHPDLPAHTPTSPHTPRPPKTSPDLRQRLRYSAGGAEGRRAAGGRR